MAVWSPYLPIHLLDTLIRHQSFQILLKHSTAVNPEIVDDGHNKYLCFPAPSPPSPPDPQALPLMLPWLYSNFFCFLLP
jgi:hypothetical protein